MQIIKDTAKIGRRYSERPIIDTTLDISNYKYAVSKQEKWQTLSKICDLKGLE